MATNLLTCCERLDESKYWHKCACPSATVDCESEQIDAELCGFSEYTDGGAIVPSTPPKKYRKETLVRSNDEYTYGCSEACEQYYGKVAVDNSYTASKTYDATTCNTTTDAPGPGIIVGTSTIWTKGGDQCVKDCGGGITLTDRPYSVLSVSDILANQDFIEEAGTVSSTTTSTYSTSYQNLFNNGSGTCQYCDPKVSNEGSELRDWTLTIEDTEADAIARETPTTGTFCSSLWETRSTGFSFTKRTSEYTIECGDLVIGLKYEVTPLIRKRTAVIDSYGAWEDVTVTPITFTATAKTETIDDAGNPIELDHVQGYEYEITGANIERTV